MSKFNFKMSKQSGKGQGCLILFGLPFFGAGAAILWFLVINPIIQKSQSDNWVKTPCLITKSELKINSDSDGSTYRPEIHYSYHYNGQKYTSEQVDFAPTTSSSDRAGESAYLKDFPLGKKRSCFVNPDNPNEAVLIKDWGRGVFKWVAIPFGGVFAFVGFGIMLWGASPWLFKRKKRSSKPNGEITLKPTGQRLGKLGGALFLCLFWNGIVSVFLVVWIAGLVNGSADGFFEKWGLGMFLTPFVCVGVFFIWGLIKEIKNFFAPKISITLKQGLTWKCGQTVDINWNIPYSAQVEEIRLNFVCQESATYRQGTNTRTDEEIVAVIPIIEKSTSNFTGKCNFTVPEEIMPSFESNNNRIKWGIQLRSEGPGPDADDLYIIDLVEA